MAMQALACFMAMKAGAVLSDAPVEYPLQAPAQLGAYLRGLRKARRLTQAQLGTMLGVTRARISEIERDPSNLGFTQLQRIVHLLGARLVLQVRAVHDAPVAASEQKAARGEW
jgi:HTH-type transcriptional regulator/antitoxin HipB